MLIPITYVNFLKPVDRSIEDMSLWREKDMFQIIQILKYFTYLQGICL